MRRRRRSDIGRIVLWSGISNLLFVGIFVASSNWDRIAQYAADYGKLRETTVVKSFDPLAFARLARQDRELGRKGVQSSLKESMPMTEARQPAVPDDVGSAEQPYEMPAPASYDGPADGPETPGAASGAKMAPIVRKDPATGQLEIGNFKPVTLDGDAAECLDMGYAMLGDTGTSNDLLEVMTATDSITIAKICAKNGSVVLSCRNQKITISPRRSRPDDNCAPKA